MLIQLRPILLVIGIALLLVAGVMFIPALTDIFMGSDDWNSFFSSGFITAFIGMNLVLLNRGTLDRFRLRDVILLLPCLYIAIAGFSALPFYFSNLRLSFGQAMFEAMAGITTTSATIIPHLDTIAPGILLWRGLLQWCGGFGAVIMAITVLPYLKIGGMHFFQFRVSNEISLGVVRTLQVILSFLGVYVFLTGACIMGLYVAGMGFFDALCHALSTVSSGGFSTRDQSIAYYNNPIIEIVLMIFMFGAALPFIGYLEALRGNIKGFGRDRQFLWLVGALVIVVSSLSIWLAITQNLTFTEGFKRSVFNSVSLVTTTGYTNENYMLWGTFPIVILLMFMVVGGCTGSTTGGMKLFRFQILVQAIKAQFFVLVQPHGVAHFRSGNRVISEDVITSVCSFMMLFAAMFMMISLSLSFIGVDFLTSLVAAASTLANYGPGIGAVGSNGSYAALPESAHWILMLSMLMGRVEIYPVFILALRFFWRD